MSRSKVLFYVQHLLGIGHVKRTITLARSMLKKNLEVSIISGGENVPVIDDTGMTFIQLPSIKASNRKFESLIDSDGQQISNELKMLRRNKLLEVFTLTDPDILIIELYPFGRRQLEFELLPLLEKAKKLKSSVKIICSVRDILVEKNKPHRDKEMIERVKQYFDLVLVHGDPSLIPFDKTFPKSNEIINLIKYTGYVVDQEKIRNEEVAARPSEILVSSGSGAVGENLLKLAIKARPFTNAKNHLWRILVGYSISDIVFHSLKESEEKGLVVERARPDFIGLLKNCRLSISQGGYNTLMETLATKANSISVPYAGGHETEQTLRTRLLAQRGLIRQIPEEDLNLEKLIIMINLSLEEPINVKHNINISGAEKTADIISSLV
ncbi:MAG: glycosyltransferase family protein [Rhodospirillales bacterium]|tara:strand:- start:28 stop:1173 length:1146 start_codon:yes stop_codon:yes gene_type:complete